MKKFNLNTTMVAFIDVLGFKEKVLSVSSKEDLMTVYSEMSRVHRFFEIDPESSQMRDAYKAISKRVKTLSDAVVISIDFNSPVARISGILDTLAAELSLIALSQGESVTNGIFLRGGVAMGYYFGQKDILISDAMVRAYISESQACYPVIAIDERFYHQFINDPGNSAYVEEIAPRNVLFDSLTNPSGEIINFIDYLNLCIDACNDWYCKKDLDAYIVEQDDEKKMNIMAESYQKNQLCFVDAHAEAIKVQLAKNYPRSVKAKYEWLRDYHNDIVKKRGYSAEHLI